MRLSKLAGKEIINLQDGGKLGVIGESDLVLAPETGDLESIIIPRRSSLFWRKEERNLIIPWNAIKKIGAEVIIVDLVTKNSGNTAYLNDTANSVLEGDTNLISPSAYLGKITT